MAALRNNSGGFTFVEVLIVVAIAGIVATTSYAYMLSARPHAQLEASEIQLSSFLSQARNLAVSEEVPTRVVFDPVNDQFKLERLTNSGTWELSGGIQDLYNGITFTDGGITLAENQARFTPRGTLLWGGAITLANSAGETSTLTANVATGKFPLVGGNLR